MAFLEHWFDGVLVGGTGWWLEGEMGGHCGAEVAGVTAAHILPSHLLGLIG